VGAGVIQVETGVAYSRSGSGASKDAAWTTPSLLRIGIGSVLELRLESELATVDASAPGVGGGSGVSDVSLGLKWHAADAVGLRPSTGVLVHVDLPTGSPRLRGTGLRPSLRLSGEWELPGGVGVGALSSAELFDPATEQWTLTGSLEAAWSAPGAARLPDGRVLLAGGFGADFKETDRTALFDPAIGLWTAGGGLNTARFSHTTTMLPDGRVLYQRWEYVDRSQVDYHHLWTANPDGSHQMVFYGNMHPGVVMIDALPIPGTKKVVASFSPGHGRREHAGTIQVVDATAGPDQKGFTRPISQGGDFRDPFPISEDCFLVARGRSILLMDGQGVTTPLYMLPAADAEADPDMEAFLAPFVDELNAYTGEVIGETLTDLDALNAYTEETGAANLQVDATKWAAEQAGYDVDFHLSGAMSNKFIPAGELTVGDMFTLMPYENALVVYRLNGPQIKTVLDECTDGDGVSMMSRHQTHDLGQRGIRRNRVHAPAHQVLDRQLRSDLDVVALDDAQ
jgi:hypothetical protein